MSTTLEQPVLEGIDIDLDLVPDLDDTPADGKPKPPGQPKPPLEDKPEPPKPPTDGADPKPPTPTVKPNDGVLNTLLGPNAAGGTGSFGDIFGNIDFDKLGPLGDILEMFIGLLDGIGGNTTTLSEESPLVALQQTFKGDLKAGLAEAAGQENPKEAIAQKLNELIDQNAEKLGIDETEAAAMKARLQYELESPDLAEADWGEISGALVEVAVEHTGKIDADNIEYGTPAADENIIFEGDSVPLYTLDTQGNFEVANPSVSVDALKDKLGEDYTVEIVKVDTVDPVSGKEVTENRGYHITNGDGVEFYLDTSALDLDEMDTKIVQGMNVVPEPDPAEPKPGEPSPAPGSEPMTKADIEIPGTNGPGMGGGSYA